MYKRILVPTDGSPLSIEAVRGAARFAKPLGASVVLITVIEPYSYTSLSEYRPESIDDYDERMRAVAEERLADARAIFDKEGVPVETVAVKSFSPAEAADRNEFNSKTATASSWPATVARAWQPYFLAVKRKRFSPTPRFP